MFIGKYKSKRLSVGCTILDTFLNGGILLQGINEIVGESGSGKSQMAMQLAIIAQTPTSQGGLDGSAVYVCTESAFPTKRLNQFIRCRFSDPALQKSTSDHILIEHAEDVDSLLNILQKRVPVLIRNFNVKLLIIDSVAALFRCEYSGSQAVERARSLYLLGDVLHRLNANLGLSIVAINQLSGIVNEERKESVSAPSLGLPWSNMVTTRLQFSRTNEILPQTAKDDQGYCYSVTKRKLQVVYSPNLPRKRCYFVVDSIGVHGILSDDSKP